LLLLLHRIKLLSLPLPLQGLKFIGLSKLFRDREAQMFRLPSKRKLRRQKQKLAAQARLTTALAAAPLQKSQARTALERAQAGLVAAKMPMLRLLLKGDWLLRRRPRPEPCKSCFHSKQSQ
jgi:hypothetical protein